MEEAVSRMQYLQIQMKQERTLTQVTFPNAGEATVPAQTDPQESPVAENSQSAQTDGKIQESAESESPSETQPPGV